MSNDYKEFGSIEDMVNYLEKEYDITVLSMRDYGSNAWNLDSDTSDMDAGMVFRQEPMDYITLGGYTQNIDRKFYLDGEEFELIGWNIKRFAELLNKSNPSMIEWLNSSITYYENLGEIEHIKMAFDEKDIGINHGILDEIKEHANQEFKPIALWGHYREMGKANYNKYIDNRNDLTIKRHLYILRGLTYAKYVLETHQSPPLDFQKFYNEELMEMRREGKIPDKVYQKLGDFIMKKTNGQGDEEIENEELWNWMENEIQRGEDINHSQHDVRGISREKVNKLIKQVVN